MEKKYDQPVYPTLEQGYNIHGIQSWSTTPGMFLIDQIAIAAMQALLSAKETDYWAPKECAENAWSYAVAMMEEREKYVK